MLDEITDDNHKVWQTSLVENELFYFQKDVVINQPINAMYINVTNNSTFLVLEGTFLRRSSANSLVPDFSLPYNNTVLTVTAMTLPCNPSQGGFIYRNDVAIPFGNVDNELVVTRATDSIGGYVVEAERPWQLRPEETQSIVVTSATDGIIMCTNVEWNLVDGALSSMISVLTLSVVMVFILRRAFF